MSLEIITGKTGEPHIDSEDIGAYNAYTIGKDSYLLNGLDMTITNVNTLHVGTGEVLFQGRHVRIKGNGEDVAIANGTTGYKRNDILCLKYQKFPQNSDIESISLELVKGKPTTGTPADPAITTGSILNGDTVVYLKLARIVVNGLTPEAPVKLLKTIDNLSSVAARMTTAETNIENVQASVTWGTSGEWIWKKYSNGYCELWCTHTYNLTRTGNYWLPDIDLPFTLYKKSGNVTEYQARVTGCDYSIGRLYASSNRTETTVNKVEIASENVKSTGDYVAFIYIFGRWK